jgi:hypothetical protein
MSENVGASTSRNPKGLHGLYRDNFTFFTMKIGRDEESDTHSGRFTSVDRSLNPINRKSAEF